jgi:Predicted transcriptional regulators
VNFELDIDAAGTVPIWKQIEDGLRRGIASGRLRPGDPLPSVREAAVRLRANPATVARAYRSLVDLGLLAVRRGEGTFVAALGRDVTDALRRDELARAADRYRAEAEALGVSLDGAKRALDGAWERGMRQERERRVKRDE